MNDLECKALRLCFVGRPPKNNATGYDHTLTPSEVRELYCEELARAEAIDADPEHPAHGVVVDAMMSDEVPLVVTPRGLVVEIHDPPTPAMPYGRHPTLTAESRRKVAQELMDEMNGTPPIIVGPGGEYRKAIAIAVPSDRRKMMHRLCIAWMLAVFWGWVAWRVWR